MEESKKLFQLLKLIGLSLHDSMLSITENATHLPYMFQECFG